MSSKEWITRTTWDGKELVFVREHSCYDLDSTTLRDIAENRIRQCEYEKKHWQELLERRSSFIEKNGNT